MSKRIGPSDFTPLVLVFLYLVLSNNTYKTIPVIVPNVFVITSVISVAPGLNMY